MNRKKNVMRFILKMKTTLIKRSKDRLTIMIKKIKIKDISIKD